MRKFMMFNIYALTAIYLIIAFVQWDILWMSEIGSWCSSIRLIAVLFILLLEMLLAACSDFKL